MTSRTIEMAPLQSLGRRWRSILIETLKAFFEPDTSLRCAGTAFFGFLWVFPVIATGGLLYGLFADPVTLATTIDSLDYVLPGPAINVVHEQLSILISQPPVALGIGILVSIVFALWSGSRGVSALIYAMSRVRSEPERRGFFISVFMSVALTVAGSIFLLVALATVAGLPALTRLWPIPQTADLMIVAIRWPILTIITIMVLAALYRWGPDRHPRKFRFIWPGALLSSLLWVLAGLLFSIYVENFSNYEASFGSVTAAVVLLLWMYNSAQIFVLGAAFNAQIEYHAKEVTRPERP
jgi:membrane protein